MCVFLTGSHNSTHLQTSLPKKPSIPVDIQGRINPSSPEHQRIQKAMHAELAPNTFYTTNREDLRTMAVRVNDAIFHYSGNCNLLSHCLLYNLTNGRSILACKNIEKFYQGIEAEDISEIVFNRQLTEVATSRDLEFLETQLIEHSSITGNRFYLIESSGYTIPILGAVGHAFNAVIIPNAENNLTVQFLDAWRRSDPAPTRENLSKRYNKGQFAAFCLI